MGPFVSICIPAYKRAEFLTRLLNSIAIQTYRDFEVIVTDDSTDDSVRALTEQYQSQFAIRYHKNPTALGSPANWNAAIAMAKGEWIKIMHDDDWFSDAHSLAAFAQTAREADPQNTSFIFSGIYEEHIDTGKKEVYIPGDLAISSLKKSPLYLFKKNYIGHPSTTLIKNNITRWYDEKVKWVVDFEFYIRYLLQHPHFMVIRRPLISIGVNEQQITKQVFRNPAVEIPEHLYFYRVLPPRSLRNIVVYDYFWRLWRNLGIRSVNDLQPYSGGEAVPVLFRKMIQWQSRFPLGLLKVGICSKTIMFFSYCYCRLAGILQ